MKITCALLTVAAGICGSAIAAGDTSVIIPGPAIDASQYVINFSQNTSRSIGTVYSGLNTDTTAGIEVNSNYSAHGADDFVLGDAAQLLNPTPVKTFGTIFVRKGGSTINNFDLTVKLYDSWSNGGADDPLFDNTTYPGQYLGGVILQVRGLPNSGTSAEAYWTGDVNVAAANITIPAAGGGMELYASAPGTQIPFKNGDISVVNGNAIQLDANVNDARKAESGLSLQRYYRDAYPANPDGVSFNTLVDNSDIRTNGLTFSSGTFAVRIKSDNVKCASDFNNDGFPDIYDFTDFVTAFEAGCP